MRATGSAGLHGLEPRGGVLRHSARALSLGAALALAAIFVASVVGPSPARAEPLPGAPPLDAPLQQRLREAVKAQPTTPAQPPASHPTAPGRSKGTSPRYTNRLILEASPYLLAHAHNPVNWYAWGDEAFAEARRLGRPIFLSIGYSTCHWCHVMEKESFQDPEIAEFLNRNFVAIKVDREEHPELDSIYLAAVRVWTGGSVGWPLTVFLTPDREPFFGDTYLPPRDDPRRGPGLLRILGEVQKLYAGGPEKVANALQETVRKMRAQLAPEASGAPGSLPARPQLAAGIAEFEGDFDAEHGGLRGQSKFPTALPVSLLLREHERSGRSEPLRMVERTLDAMRRGGIHDAVGGGFHRYTVEPTWSVPHFEKMLSDNAWLASTYLDAWQVTHRPEYAEVARDIFAYVQRDLADPEGGFYTASDADSDGGEGRYFVWTPAQVRAAVGDALAPLALMAYGLEAPPNFGQAYVLRRDLEPAELAAHIPDASPEDVDAWLAQIRVRLQSARAARAAPLRDEKQVVAWNALMISALARGSLLLDDPALGDRAVRAADFLLERARTAQGLARYVKNGAARGSAVLDDYAFFVSALLDLFELRAEPRWLEAALTLQGVLDAGFWDESGGGYWHTAAAAQGLIVRSKPVLDDALPSPNAVAARNLLRLHALGENPEFRKRAERTIAGLWPATARSPLDSAGLLEALDALLREPSQIFIAGDAAQAQPFVRAVAETYLPDRVLIVADDARAAGLLPRLPWLADKRALRGKATAYLCTGRVCQKPATDPAEFTSQLRALAAAPHTAPAPSAVDGGTVQGAKTR